MVFHTKMCHTGARVFPCNERNEAERLKIQKSYLESGYLVRVARLLVYMCPPTSMCTGAFDLVS